MRAWSTPQISRLINRNYWSKTNDTIYIGFSYEDKSGATQWRPEVVLTGSSLFDLYDRSWEEVQETAYVGESIYMAAVDPLSNESGERDESTVAVVTSSGWSGELNLRETLSHSGNSDSCNLYSQ